MSKYAEEDEKERILHRIEVTRNKDEFISANEEALNRKKLNKELEKQEIKNILIYQALQDDKMAKREELETEIEHKKKERQAQLLANQERVQNNAGKLDELRARRAEEERERRQRIIEKELATKKMNDTTILMNARMKQENDKQLKIIKDNELLKQQTINDYEYNLKLQQKEDYNKQYKINESIKHRKKVELLIETRKNERNINKLSNNNESIQLRQEKLSDVTKFTTIRDKMVKDLAEKGVNPKYLTEMKQVDIDKLVNI